MIDTSIHHRWAEERDVHPYLDPGWREYVGEAGSLPLGLGARRLVPATRYPNPMGDDLPDAIADDGRSVGANVDSLDKALLGPTGVERGLLLFDKGMFAASHPNPYFAAAVVRAINDWNIDQWLRGDERLYGAVLVPRQIPAEGAAEIRRIGPDLKIAGALLAVPSLGRLLGHPIYDPIFEAAAELHLPVILHSGFDALPDTPTGPAGGEPFTFAEYWTTAPLAVVTNVISLITNGVLVRHPDLRVFVVGAGIAWVGGTLMRLDQTWNALRRDVPWVREPPSAYFRRHIRISTYGIERSAALPRLIEATPGLDELLCYGSGFPSWDTLGPDEAAELFRGVARPRSARKRRGLVPVAADGSRARVNAIQCVTNAARCRKRRGVHARQVQGRHHRITLDRRGEQRIGVLRCAQRVPPRARAYLRRWHPLRHPAAMRAGPAQVRSRGPHTTLPVAPLRVRPRRSRALRFYKFSGALATIPGYRGTRQGLRRGQGAPTGECEVSVTPSSRRRVGRGTAAAHACWLSQKRLTKCSRAR